MEVGALGERFGLCTCGGGFVLLLCSIVKVHIVCFIKVCIVCLIFKVCVWYFFLFKVVFLFQVPG